MDPNAYAYPMVAFTTAFGLNLLTLLFERDSSKFQLALMACYISLLAAVTDYLSLTGHAPIVRDVRGQGMHLLRWLMFLHTTPIMVYLLSVISDFKRFKVRWGHAGAVRGGAGQAALCRQAEYAVNHRGPHYSAGRTLSPALSHLTTLPASQVLFAVFTDMIMVSVGIVAYVSPNIWMAGPSTLLIMIMIIPIQSHLCTPIVIMIVPIQPHLCTPFVSVLTSLAVLRSSRLPTGRSSGLRPVCLQLVCHSDGANVGHV